MKAPEQANGSDGVIRIFTDGAGCRPGGKGSGFAWLRHDTGQKQVKREDNLTNNQAEYRAILSAIESVDSGSKAEILTDSENTCFQLRGERRVRDPRLAELHAQIQEVISKKQLTVTFTWIPRRENLAGKLI
jgi:ribonuclease HI